MQLKASQPTLWDSLEYKVCGPTICLKQDSTISHPYTYTDNHSRNIFLELLKATLEQILSY